MKLCLDNNIGMVPFDEYYVDDPFGWLVLLWSILHYNVKPSQNFSRFLQPTFVWILYLDLIINYTTSSTYGHNTILCVCEFSFDFHMYNAAFSEKKCDQKNKKWYKSCNKCISKAMLKKSFVGIYYFHSTTSGHSTPIAMLNKVASIGKIVTARSKCIPMVVKNHPILNPLF